MAWQSEWQPTVRGFFYERIFTPSFSLFIRVGVRVPNREHRISHFLEGQILNNMRQRQNIRSILPYLTKPKAGFPSLTSGGSPFLHLRGSPSLTGYLRFPFLTFRSLFFSKYYEAGSITFGALFFGNSVLGTSCNSRFFILLLCFILISFSIFFILFFCAHVISLSFFNRVSDSFQFFFPFFDWATQRSKCSRK